MKHSLRKEILERRREHPAEELAVKSHLITHLLIDLPEFQKAKVVAFYFPVNGEVDTLDMIRWAHEDGKEVCVPVVEKGKGMKFVIYDPVDELKSGAYNIPEPVGKPEREHVDLVVVPGVVFDKNGHRIGMGKGFYDKFLKDKKCVKVGVCFSFQMVDCVPKEEHDVQMDIVINEHEVLRFKKK